MELNHKKIIIGLSALFAVCLGFDIFLHTLSSHTTVWNNLYGLLYGLQFLFGGLISIFGSRRLTREQGKRAFMLWGLALLGQAGGLFIWAVYNFFLGVAVPFPSLADASFILFHIGMGFGLWEYRNLFEEDNSDFGWLSTVPLVVIACIMVFIVLRRPDLSTQLPLMQRIVNVTATVGDAFIISMALTTALIRELRSFGFLTLILGLVMFAVAEFTFTYEAAKGIFWAGDLADLIYTISGFILSIGIIKLLKEHSASYKVK
jgi:hypothetical protein